MTSVPPEPPAGSEPSATPPPPPAPPPPPPAAATFPPQATDPGWAAPPPPAGAGAGAGGPVDLAAVKPMDWGIIAAGILALIFSTFDYYTGTAKAEGRSISSSINAWHGFFGWFATLVALAASVLLAVHILAPKVTLPIPVRLTVLSGYALSLLCMIIAGFVTPGASSAADLSRAAGVKVTVDYGRGVGFYLSLIVILAGVALSFLRLRETGNKLPWDKSA
jgi:hypothetical protein